MHTTSNNFTVEALVAKYYNYVMEHCPKSTERSEATPLYRNQALGIPIEDEKVWPVSPDANADEQLLVTLYRMVAGKDADKRVLSVLDKYAQKFMKEGLEQEELAFLCEHFSEVVAYEFLDRGSWYTAYSLWEAPSQIYSTIDLFADPQPGQTVFIADAGYGDIASMFPHCTVKGFNGWNSRTWALGQIRLYAAGITSEIFDDTLGNTGTLPEKGSVDVVVYGNVWLQGRRNLQEFYDLLKEGGKMFLLLDREALAGKEYGFSLRQQLIKDKSIQTIISFENDRIDDDCDDWLSSNYILLYIEKLAHEKVGLVNLKKKREKFIDSDLLDPEILWPSYYDAIRPQNGIPLSKLIAEFKKDSHDTWWLKKQNEKHSEDTGIPFILPNNLGDTYIDAGIEYKQINSYKKDRSSYSADYVNEPCLLISEDTEKLKVGYITKGNDKGFAYSDCRCLIPLDRIDVRYISALLFDPLVKDQIQTIFDGSVIWDDVLSLVLDKIIVPNHNEKERLNYLAEANYEALISSQEKLKQEAEHYQKAVRMRKHALTQLLSAIEARFYALNTHRIRQNGTIVDNEIISHIKGTTVQEAFEFILKSLNDIKPALEHVADVEYSFEKPEWIDPERFVEDYVANKENGWWNFKPVITWEKGNNKARRDVKDKEGRVLVQEGHPLKTFLFPTDALELIFANIIANAQAHGFTDESRKDYQLRFSWRIDGLSLVIEIENNGTPLPSDRDPASLLEYGVSSALHHDGHNGIGCHEIYEIMKRYGGSVEIIPSTQDDYTVKYVLTYNRVNIVRNK